MAAAKVYSSATMQTHTHTFMIVSTVVIFVLCVCFFCMQSTKDKIYCKSLNSPSIFIYLMKTAKKLNKKKKNSSSNNTTNEHTTKNDTKGT